MNLGVVGNRNFNNKNIIKYYLLKILPDMVVTGDAIGVDSIVADICSTNNIPIIIVHSTAHSKQHYFNRNKVIAKLSDNLLAFIKKNRYRCGTFNTINHFTKLNKSGWVIIVNEYGKTWSFNELPNWLKNRKFRLVTDITEITNITKLTNGKSETNRDHSHA